MVAIHGASPSGRWAVVGRLAPPLVPGRLADVAEAVRFLGCVFVVLTLRAPVAVVVFAGVFAFIGDFCGDFGGDPLPDVLEVFRA